MVIPRAINNNYNNKCFCEFKEIYYMPNEVLENIYPDDILYLSNEL